VQLVSKISNLCDHKSPTSQTERRTDKRSTCDRKTALCTKVHCAVKTGEPMHYRLSSHWQNSSAHSALVAASFRVDVDDSRHGFILYTLTAICLASGLRRTRYKTFLNTFSTEIVRCTRVTILGIVPTTDAGGTPTPKVTRCTYVTGRTCKS